MSASQFSAYFAQRVRRLRRLTSHEIVRSTIRRRGVVAYFLPSQRSWAVFGVHRLPLPADPTMLPCVVILFISFSKTPIFLHLWKRSWTTLEDTANQSRWRAFHWHPVQRARTYLGVDDGPITGPRPAAFGTHLPVFGQALLGFPPQRAEKVKVVNPPGCGSLSHKAHLL